MTPQVRIYYKLYFYFIFIFTNDGPDQSSYPFLHTLLHFDTREFLNVLSLVSLTLCVKCVISAAVQSFEEDDFGTTEGIPTRQGIVDILLEIMVGDRKSFTVSITNYHSVKPIACHIYTQVLRSIIVKVVLNVNKLLFAYQEHKITVLCP